MIKLELPYSTALSLRVQVFVRMDELGSGPCAMEEYIQLKLVYEMLNRTIDEYNLDASLRRIDAATKPSETSLRSKINDP